MLLARRSLFGLTLIVLQISIGCSRRATETSLPAQVEGPRATPQLQKPTTTAPAASRKLPPNRCRIEATVVRLPQRDPSEAAQRETTDQAWAVVRVDSILAYGAAFGRPLAKKREITVKFLGARAGTTLRTGMRIRTTLEQLERIGTAVPVYATYWHDVAEAPPRR